MCSSVPTTSSSFADLAVQSIDPLQKQMYTILAEHGAIMGDEFLRRHHARYGKAFDNPRMLTIHRNNFRTRMIKAPITSACYQDVLTLYEIPIDNVLLQHGLDEQAKIPELVAELATRRKVAEEILKAFNCGFN